MAQPLPPQVPQHVSALLSHLTSRPGVQSTLILSRKDGSIIQSTGLLAAASVSLGAGNTINTDSTENVAAPVVVPASSDLTSPAPSSSHQDSPATLNATTNATASPQNQNKEQSYKPSQAETLAAHIFAFMTSASGLALSLSGSGSTGSEDIGFESRSRSAINGIQDSGTATPTEKRPDDTMGGRSNEREEDDEIKLLRLRTKKHEIVVVPDRKYLLCVVHDASGAAATSSSGGAGASR